MNLSVSISQETYNIRYLFQLGFQYPLMDSDNTQLIAFIHRYQFPCMDSDKVRWGSWSLNGVAIIAFSYSV